MDTRQSDAKTVAGLVAGAVAAPSMHNAQPWRFRFVVSERVLLLFADLERAVPRFDAGNRALHIGCGAALFNLRVAAAQAGFAPVVDLLPDPAEPLRLAAVRLGEAGAAVPAEDDLARLHPAICRRHTSRHPFEEEDIPEGIQRAPTAPGPTTPCAPTPGAWSSNRPGRGRSTGTNRTRPRNPAPARA
ncbi:hypothetical protein [Streptomyces glomeratus]|uniref:Nitroreductase domain-containing protein n=1 Tax=Streptomyces glomeratus TaxID=284452 RepID=A0ABP6M2I5_9ACTN